MGANAILYPILPGNLTLGRETEEGEGRVETVGRRIVQGLCKEGKFSGEEVKR